MVNKLKKVKVTYEYINIYKNGILQFLAILNFKSLSWKIADRLCYIDNVFK